MPLIPGASPPGHTQVCLGRLGAATSKTRARLCAAWTKAVTSRLAPSRRPILLPTSYHMATPSQSSWAGTSSCKRVSLSSRGNWETVQDALHHVISHVLHTTAMLRRSAASIHLGLKPSLMGLTNLRRESPAHCNLDLEHTRHMKLTAQGTSMPHFLMQPSRTHCRKPNETSTQALGSP